MNVEVHKLSGEHWAHRSDRGLVHSGPRETCISMDCIPPSPKWADLFGIDPDYTDGKPVDVWLDEQRGDA